MKNHIIIGDCRDALKTLTPKSVHLIVTSPPYNLNINYGKWNDRMPFDDYMDFSRAWLEECYRVLRDDGRICVNVPLYTHRNLQRNLLNAYQNLMTEIGFIERDTIFWIKMFGMELSGSSKVWGTWNPANPIMEYPCEAIIVMNKKEKRLSGWKSDITKRQLYKWRNNVWFFPPESDRSHPAPFPEELPRRLIKFFSFVGQTILDPFLGSGTTMKVANGLNRKCIGIELDDRYLEMIKTKVGINQSDLTITYHSKNPSGLLKNPASSPTAESKTPKEFDWRDWEHEIERFFDF